MEKAKTGPKDFFLWAGAMIALYVSVVSFISLFFSYIDIAFPDSLSSYIDPYSTAIRVAMASLIVLLPVYFVLMHYIRSDVAKEPAKRNLWVRRWALVLTIFIAGATVAIDLITLINTYLGGELTTHFVLKVVIVLLVMSAGLMHFLAELWGYWDINPQRALTVGIGVSVLVVATIMSGFLIIGTPSQVRLYRFDDQKVNDLETIQSFVLNYWQTEGVLPKNTAALIDPLNGAGSIPSDAQFNRSYEYATTSALSFKLCADFNAETQPNSPTISVILSQAVPVGANGDDFSNDMWYHQAGHVCFERTIDPKRYPPATQPAVAK